MGFVTLEQFMLKKQAEERRQNRDMHSLRPRPPHDNIGEFIILSFIYLLVVVILRVANNLPRVRRCCLLWTARVKTANAALHVLCHRT